MGVSKKQKKRKTAKYQFIYIVFEYMYWEQTTKKKEKKIKLIEQSMEKPANKEWEEKNPTN